MMTPPHIPRGVVLEKPLPRFSHLSVGPQNSDSRLFNPKPGLMTMQWGPWGQLLLRYQKVAGPEGT